MAATICPAKPYKSEWGDLNSQYGIPNAECYPVTPHSVNLSELYQAELHLDKLVNYNIHDL